MYKTVQGVRLYCRSVGEGKPVVLLHGLGCDHRLMAGCMEPVFEHRPGYRRIYVDLPGMGRSDAPMEQASSDGILELLRALVAELTAGERILLVGESYGGYLARGLLTTELGPLADGLLLICPVTVPEPEKRELPPVGALRYDEDFLRELGPKERAAFCNLAVLANRRVYERYEKEISSGLGLSNGEFVAALRRSYSFSFDVDAQVRALGFDRPALLLAGRQDICVGYRDLWKLLEDMPRAAFALLDLAGHNLQIERPEVFAALVGDWLDRAEDYL
ncbi:alpha/beta hydrolase [Oscillibacter sp.]|uniref:alpha/beta fold hydrolase n=1 Tax=Oscillibacter sp. TaxID=1945593 RepID=UPI00289ACD27|nr:alpha/beta hydrolase [Oscillibacter sp.]